jgi:Domain of Unknown Function (DUF1080)
MDSLEGRDGAAWTRPPSRAGSAPAAWLLRLLGGCTLLAGIALILTLPNAPQAGMEGWRVAYDGYGSAGMERAEDGQQVHYLAPMSAQRPEETHAALLLSTQPHRDLELTLRVRTVRQLRQRSAPNPWETAWVVWHYQDDLHFYYLALKPNGWEIGKRDPAFPGGQRFLISDSAPVYKVTSWHEVQVVQVGNVMAVWADGRPLARLTDTESPYTEGYLGLYSEDAHAQFADVQARPHPQP